MAPPPPAIASPTAPLVTVCTYTVCFDVDPVRDQLVPVPVAQPGDTWTLLLPQRLRSRMTSTFNLFRLATQAVLIASLLVFGHVLLTTLATTPVPVKSLSEELPGAIKSLSALTFLSLLWLSFTLLEAADQALPPQPGLLSSDPEARREEDDIWVFLRTDMQIALGLCASVSWALYWKSAALIIVTFSASIAPELILLRVSFLLSMAALTVNQLQVLISLIMYATTPDAKEMLHRSFWKGKMGWWAERIKLEDESFADKV